MGSGWVERVARSLFCYGLEGGDDGVVEVGGGNWMGWKGCGHGHRAKFEWLDPLKVRSTYVAV